MAKYGSLKTPSALFGRLKLFIATTSTARSLTTVFEGLKCFEPISRLHDGLVDVLQLGRNDELGYFYYVMEAADDVSSGQTIDPATYSPLTLERKIRDRGRLPVEESIEISLALATAL